MRKINKAVYNGGLDFWKLIFTFVIVIYHYAEISKTVSLFKSGSIAVEFFFILSGYFMAISAERKPFTEKLGTDTAQFIWRKIKSILPYYLIGWLIAAILNMQHWLMEPRTLGEIVLRISNMLPNFLLLSVSGMPEEVVLGVTWYISAMLLAMAVIYPLLRKYKNIYLRIIAPLSAILLTGYLSQKYGGFFLSYEFDGFVPQNIIRACVGINIGCVVYVAAEKMKTIDFTIFSRILLGLVEIGGYIWILVAMTIFPKTYVFTELFIFLAVVTITASKKGIFSSLFDNNIVMVVSSISLPLFLLHPTCRAVIRREKWPTDWDLFYKYLIAAVASALACMIVVWLFGKIKEKVGKRARKIFIK